jgi:hypothetical protein
VFVGSYDGKVYALHATTGAKRWEFPTGNAVHSSPAVSPDGSTVFVGSDDKNVYALHVKTGEQLWAFPTGGAVRSSPAVSPDGSTVFVGSDDKNVYALHVKTGEQLWSFPTGGAVRSSPAVSPDGSTVFVGSRDSKVYALNATRWVKPLWAFATGNNVDSSPAVSPDGSTVFVGSDDKKVYALIATTGSQLWAFATGGVVSSSPAVSPDCATVFVSSHDANVYALNSNPPCRPGSSGLEEKFMHEVRINLSLPMSLSDFTKHQQKAFKASLVYAAFCDELRECFVGLDGVVKAVVITKIESISSRRHLLEDSIRLETSLMTTDKAIAQEGAGNLTANNINRELSMACPQLPTATVLEAAKVVAVSQWPSTTEEEKECSFTDAVKAQLPILFFCGVAYLGVKSKCSFAPKKTEAQEMLPTTGVAAPSQTPVTSSSNATVALVFPTPTTQEMLQMGEQGRPTGLPKGWQACIDQAGNVYYQNRTTKQTQWEYPAWSFPWGELRTVTLNRNPSSDGAQQTGIGISFFRPEMSGPSEILRVAPAGTAFQSGLIHAGDLLFKVNRASVLYLTSEQIKDQILGEPSSPITLTISTPPAPHASQPQLPQTPGTHSLAQTHGVGADPQARASDDTNLLHQTMGRMDEAERAMAMSALSDITV